MEIILKKENLEEAEKFLNILQKMDEVQKHELCIWMQGIVFANKLEKLKEHENN